MGRKIGTYLDLGVGRGDHPGDLELDRGEVRHPSLGGLLEAAPRLPRNHHRATEPGVAHP